MSRALPWFCGAGVAAAVAVAAVASRHAHPAEVSPVQPAGAWNGAWIAALLVAFALYAVGVAVLHRSPARPLAALVVAMAIQAIPLGAPLLLSKDAYLYWADARIVTVHHASPYRTTPADVASDPAVDYTSEQWRNEGAPYGPVWETLALAPGAAAGTSAHHAAFAYKLLAFLGVLAVTLVVFFATRSAAAVALVGWSPLVAAHFAGGGHNDVWLMTLICVGVVAARSPVGGGAWSLAGAFKPVGVVLLPLELAAARLRRPRGFWLGLVGTAAAVGAASAAAWGTGWIRASLVGVHGASPLGGVHWLTEAGLSHRNAVIVGGLVFACIYVALLRRAWRTGKSGLALAAVALCLTTSLLRPWYGIWPLALAAVEVDVVAAAAAVALSAYLLFGDAIAL